MRQPTLLLLICLAAPTFAQEPDAEPTEAEAYAGSEMCAVCHEDVSLALEKSPHAQIATLKGGAWQGQECETCHGPGGAHSESADVDLIFGFKNEAARTNQACLECHRDAKTSSGRLMGSHDRNALDCVSCHSIHHSERRHLLRAESNALCSSCHADVSAAFNRPFRHKLHEGAIECADCHNPHGQPPPASLTRVSANEIGCLKCHADKRGPFPFEHAPVKMEPCSTCHEPHGSSNPRMMTRHNVAQLCLECHTTTLTTLGGSPPGFHDVRSPRFRNCTTCHSKIHGSFVSPDFLR